MHEVVEQVRGWWPMAIPKWCCPASTSPRGALISMVRRSLARWSARILNDVPDLKRLRLSSIDSIEADPELMDVIAGEKRLMPHIHLSLQSGDNMILKRMKRRHAREDSIAFCDELRSRRPGIVFGADIIAGFPTETEEMFENSLRIVDECGLTYLHVFPFSPRPGTPAARMPQLDKAGDQGARRSACAQRAKSGCSASSAIPSGPRGRCWLRPKPGRTEHFAQVKFAQSLSPGAIVRAQVTGPVAHHLEARLAA